jgi:small subunit ribosomal protein S14
MAKISSIEKNEKRKRMTLKYAPKRKALKLVIMSKKLPLEERFEAQLQLAKMPRNGAKNRIKNRCSISGRTRGYHRKFKMSRIWLRTLAGEGQLPGVIKASW